MSTIKTLAAVAFGAGALASPALALAAGTNELRSAPQIRLIDGEQAKLTFTTDDPLKRTAAGSYRISVEFIHGSNVSKPAYAGRHGDDYRYTVRVAHSDELQVGRKYNVRFTFPGQKPVVRPVKVHGEKG